MAVRVVILLSLYGIADAWGPDGHTIVAHIGEQFLTPEAHVEIRKLLGNYTLSHASDWNDDYDHSSEGRWSEPLHFINYPEKACYFDWSLACKNDWCNVGSIANYSSRVADTSLSLADRAFALRFIIHMMGDVHQPLHVADISDRGGNTIHIDGVHLSADSKNWTNRTTNLHACWDNFLVVQDIYESPDPEKLGSVISLSTTTSGTGYSISASASRKPFPVHYHQWNRLSEKLEAYMADGGNWSDKVSEWQKPLAKATEEVSLRDGLAEIANGSAKAGCKYAYVHPDGTPVKSGDTLTREYFLHVKPIIEEQLAKGGVRLAQLLNVLLGKTKISEPIIV